MSNRPMLFGVLASVVAFAIGVWLGGSYTSNLARREFLGNAMIGTAGHMDTLISIAGAIRDKNSNDALDLAESMIGADVVLVGPSIQDIDGDTRARVRKALSALATYCSQYSERRKYTPCGPREKEAITSYGARQ